LAQAALVDLGKLLFLRHRREPEMALIHHYLEPLHLLQLPHQVAVMALFMVAQLARVGVEEVIMQA
jgi:hypothetical protein